MASKATTAMNGELRICGGIRGGSWRIPSPISVRHGPGLPRVPRLVPPRPITVGRTPPRRNPCPRDEAISIYTKSRYQRVDTIPGGMLQMTKVAPVENEIRAKLFFNGRSQAVRLPKEFRFEGNEVRIRHAFGGVLLEPVEPVQKPWTTLEELYERLAVLRDGHLFPEREEQPPGEDRDPIL